MKKKDKLNIISKITGITFSLFYIGSIIWGLIIPQEICWDWTENPCYKNNINYMLITKIYKIIWQYILLINAIIILYSIIMIIKTLIKEKKKKKREIKKYIKYILNIIIPTIVVFILFLLIGVLGELIN